MTKKVLFCATVDYHFEAFHLPYMKWFKDNGWNVHVAAHGDLDLMYVDKKYNLPFKRSPISVNNIKAYKELKRIIDNNQYDIVHCHTPVAGVLARLAAKQARKRGTKVIYTAHGFHFCNGAPFINWLIYYPVERVLARGTDCLVTINQEDYSRAVSHKFKAGRIECIRGVGVDTNRFKPVAEQVKLEIRQNNRYKTDDFLMFYAAEFNKNKNQQFLIKVLARLKEKMPNARLLLAGNGLMADYCRELSQQLGVTEMVDFLGYRKDIDVILPMCDLAVASSFREGLPVNIMEAMSCGLPVVAIDNRGHRELIYDGENGWLISPGDIDKMSEKIQLMAQNKHLRSKMGYAGRDTVKNRYCIDKIIKEMSAIYSNVMD